MNFIDVCGVGNSGKGALVDLLRELDDIYVPEWSFEFDMIRVPGGLLDFRHCLVDDWSPIRSHAAYHSFLDVVNKMGHDPAPWDLIGLLASCPQRYDRRFKGEFRSLSHEFAEKFKLGSYKSVWPYDALKENGFIRLAKRVGRRLGYTRALFDEVLLLDGENFDLYAREYLESLYKLIAPDNCKDIVFNNAFEPFNPGPGLSMVGGRQIVVTRDPRDIYVSGLNIHNVSKKDKALLGPENDGLSKSFLATDDLDLFVKRFRLYQEKLFCGTSDNVLHMPFEGLIFDYQSCVEKILDFLDIDPARHVEPQTHFIPSHSKKNVGLWRQSDHKDEIKFITAELSEYLVEY